MRPTIRRILLSIVLVSVASLFALHPPAPESDPAWWILGGLRKPPPAPTDILVLDAIPGTVLNPGELALDLREFAEFGAGSVIVDLPVDWAAGDSTPVDSLARLRRSIDSEFTGIGKDLDNFWQGLRSGSLRAVDAVSGFAALQGFLQTSRGRLLTAATPDSEELPSLEAAFGLHHDLWFGLGLKPLPEAPSDAESAWLAASALTTPSATSAQSRGSTESNDPGYSLTGDWRLPEIAGLEIPPPEISTAAAGTGFTLRNQLPASSAKIFGLERFTPLAVYDGKIVLHPALLVLAKRLGASRIALDASGIRLVGARAFSPPQGPARSQSRPLRDSRNDVLIPLDAQGRASLGRIGSDGNWPPRLPLTILEDYRDAEARVVEALGALEKAGLLVDRKAPTELWRLASAQGNALLAGSSQNAAADGNPGAGPGVIPGPRLDAGTSPGAVIGPSPLAGPSQATGSLIDPLAEWKASKAAFFGAAAEALKERGRMDELLSGLLETPGLTDQAQSGVASLRDKADKGFAAVQSALDDWQAAKEGLSKSLAGSLIIIGDTPYRSRGGFIPARGAPPVDPSGDMAAFIRAGTYDSFMSVASPPSILSVALLAGLILASMLALLGPRYVLAAGIFVGLAFLVFSALALADAGTWWSPTIPLGVVLLPGVASLIHDALRKASGRGAEIADET
ncbi:MAG TPA: hypothetical protein VMV83_13425 [Rectinemataceae bacterium]|nr:hypothetical protein [Rectinemataceae bacterium]